jgi:hypothetical protein
MPKSVEHKIADGLAKMLPLVIKIKKHDGPLKAKDKARIKQLRALIRKAKKTKPSAREGA